MMPKLSAAQYLDAAFDAGVKAPYLPLYTFILYRRQVLLRPIPGADDGAMGLCLTASVIKDCLKFSSKTCYRQLSWLQARGFLGIRKAKAPHGTILRANWIVSTSKLESIIADACARARNKPLVLSKKPEDWPLPVAPSDQLSLSLTVAPTCNHHVGQDDLHLEDLKKLDENLTKAPTGADASAYSLTSQKYLEMLYRKQALDAIEVVLNSCEKYGRKRPHFSKIRDHAAMSSFMEKAAKRGLSVESTFLNLDTLVKRWPEFRTKLKAPYLTHPANAESPTFVALNGCFVELLFEGSSIPIASSGN